jgi:hypothetical protein
MPHAAPPRRGEHGWFGCGPLDPWLDRQQASLAEFRNSHLNSFLVQMSSKFVPVLEYKFMIPNSTLRLLALVENCILGYSHWSTKMYIYPAESVSA